LADQSLVGQALASQTLVNQTLVNQTLVNQTLADRSDHPDGTNISGSAPIPLSGNMSRDLAEMPPALTK
jgi:hypothetical protein